MARSGRPTRARRRRAVDASAARSTATGHRFHTDLTIVSGALRARASLDGRRLADGTSIGTLRWRGPVALLLDDQDFRIVDDEIATRVHGSISTWETQGSAAGVALDVGRELLMHPRLLRVTGAGRAGSVTRVDFAALATALRAYASTERRGPVSDLFSATRGLSISSFATGPRLGSDRFLLRTTVPSSVARGPIRAGAKVTIAGATAYCPLRAPH